MAYTWTNGEVITAEKLNQTGGGGGSQIIDLLYDDEDSTYYFEEDETSIQTQLVQGASIIFKTSDNEWYYPTSISGGCLVLISFTAYQGTSYLMSLASNGNGVFTQTSHQLS